MISALTSAEVYRTNELNLVGREIRTPKTDVLCVMCCQFALGLVSSKCSLLSDLGKSH